MNIKERFRQKLEEGYKFKSDSIIVGSAILDDNVLTDAFIKIPLKSINRHGLISGATGTGKTKSLQVLAENLSLKGVPVLLMDMKGDLSGLAKEGAPHPKIDERHTKIGLPFSPRPFPVELLSLEGFAGVNVKATISEFGPLLLSKILNLTEAQSGILSVLFLYSQKTELPILDIKDLKQILIYAKEEGKKEIEKNFGLLSSVSINGILRKIVSLEQEGADKFFGEISFDVNDLVRVNSKGTGIISILRTCDIQDKPKLFSAFMLCLLTEIYDQFPERGDKELPKLAVFIDEAHLLFKDASKELVDKIEIIVKLIRSKGVGIYFVTQNPIDIPSSILSQLGLKIQHSLRAFTPKDRKAIKLVSENYPISEYYKTSEIITNLGIGCALITALNEKGIPTPLAATMMRAPMSRMDILSEREIDETIENSLLVNKYNQKIDRESAYEKLSKKIFEKDKTIKEKRKSSAEDNQPSALEKVIKSSTGKMIIRELTRGILGALGLSPTRRRTTRRRKSNTSRRKKY